MKTEFVFNPLSGEFDIVAYNSSTSGDKVEQLSCSVYVGMSSDNKLSDNERLTEYQCSVTNETVISDIYNDAEGKYMVVGVQSPYSLDYIASNGICIPVAVVGTQEFNGQQYNVCYSIAPFGVGAIENISIKIN
ncbi:MAG: hypothetical protein IJZ06_09650 [Bacteroidales bacterium]|nr:hypothetical protein [Bacteroidales bacterium]MBQ8761663.1 hypothetical protein [Bacteroidales bacterium]